MHKYRTHKCGEINDQHIGQIVKLSGWVSRKRDHGNLLFVDLRDHYGIVQCVFESDFKGFKLAESIPNESVITITGKVISRDSENINLKLPTGKVEIAVEEISILSSAKELPLPVSGCPTEYPEETRLKYRFLDLRREEVHKNIILRSEVISYIRKFMVEKYNFKEYQTPILTSSSPEGARDFLVPSRLNPGQFYALPQAPQQFKQLIMLSGFDRYFQIAPCFRDEDARADRSPGEFYQLDMEMSFVTQEDVLEINEELMKDIFTKFGNKKISDYTFPRIAYNDALEKYGTDKPDLRNPLIIQDLSQIFINSGFKIFDESVSNGSVVKAIKANCPNKSRSFFDKLNDWARSQGMPGLGYIVFTENETQGPIGKNLNESSISQIKTISNIQPGDVLFFACNTKKTAQSFAGKIRTKLAQELELISNDEFKFCWVVDMPMYEWNEKEEKIDFSHNPFSMPQGGLEALNTKDPLDILAYQYDIVCNGIELSSGAIRNHDQETMIKAFEIAGYSKSEIEDKFSCLFNAFAYGSPPHGGIAPGIDRIIMLLADTENIREVIMFPMNQKGQDLLMSAPSEVSEQQLKELKIKIDIHGNKIK